MWQSSNPSLDELAEGGARWGGQGRSGREVGAGHHGVGGRLEWRIGVHCNFIASH